MSKGLKSTYKGFERDSSDSKNAPREKPPWAGSGFAREVARLHPGAAKGNGFFQKYPSTVALRYSV